MNAHTVLDLPTYARLRELRLWHWQQVVLRRQFAQGKGLAQRYRDAENACADTHLLFVQTLNEFFPLGDTAERDAAK